MRGKPNAQIALSRWGDDRDCRLETSLSRFSELAETWYVLCFSFPSPLLAGLMLLPQLHRSLG